jgi:hypothetical protein
VGWNGPNDRPVKQDYLQSKVHTLFVKVLFHGGPAV